MGMGSSHSITHKLNQVGGSSRGIKVAMFYAHPVEGIEILLWVLGLEKGINLCFLSYTPHTRTKLS